MRLPWQARTQTIEEMRCSTAAKTSCRCILKLSSNTDMQNAPSTQLKISHYMLAKPERDNDCFIVEPGDNNGNKKSNGPNDSVVVPATTPKRHPKIYDNDDDDDDDEPLASRSSQKSPAIKNTVSASKRGRSKRWARSSPGSRTRQTKTPKEPVSSTDG